ncbi:UTRA domain-containing protein [Maritalea porphyrae]|uniref:UTRA domain-containing protein n=1 Tax=Maritalea porphyrae TaxID=880732 RepID=UPI0022B03C78|nr:UTRA domain-containing protein [Maritalea porphyrae]MCZ4272136.1 UTRA domain-containing protein [Maritalea porphyrae]
MTTRPEPVYLKIKNELLDRIRNGELRPGDKVEHEEIIAQQYDCARATVHRAIRELAEEGYVERKRRAGTRVASAGTRATRVTIPLVRQEIEERGASYRFTVLEQSVRETPQAIAENLGVERGTKALYLRCVHFASDIPFQLEERWINLEMVPEAEHANFDQINPNEWLVQSSPYSEAAHFFSAQNANAEQASTLNVLENDALFVIERRTHLGGKAITYAQLLHPGANYRMTAKNFSFSTKN